MSYGVLREGRGRRLPEVLNEEEFAKIVSVTKNKRHLLAFKLGFFCGLRVSEIVKLLSSDVDVGRKMLFVRQGKGHKDRYVPFPVPLGKALNGLPVGCGVRALEIAFKKASKRAGIVKDVHFHTLRHSAATFYLKRGMSLVQVQQLLGHSSISTTMIYSHISPTDVQNTMNDIFK